MERHILFNNLGRLLFGMSSAWPHVFAVMCLAILLAKTSHQRETLHRLRMRSAYGVFLRRDYLRTFLHVCWSLLSAVFLSIASFGRNPSLKDMPLQSYRGTQNTGKYLRKLTFPLTHILCNSIFYILRTQKMNVQNNTAPKPSRTKLTDQDIQAAFDFTNLKAVVAKNLEAYKRNGGEEKITASIVQEKVAMAA
jgi:hypothetical protein